MSSSAQQTEDLRSSLSLFLIIGRGGKDTQVEIIGSHQRECQTTVSPCDRMRSLRSGRADDAVKHESDDLRLTRRKPLPAGPRPYSD